eukprot:CAMPEP_0178516806 /NCGR_PEP_ID=MMETSP0696-20121128/25330_1 /TAXON_ID=265572 /ORGANISM="Extubocellulus spinifer, Strain CCMP396" /LENGTH=226 /DNA_ID=CAMNT_0020147147 /DNA_START=36 /DNA_END=716 /DNA_ORIENTATION=-
MSTKSARQAWNQAMASAGQRLPGTSTTRRSSDRRKKQSRRDRARKSTAVGDDDDGGTDAMTYRAAARIDVLEDVIDGDDNDDEEEYDELEEIEGRGGGGAGSKRKRRGMATKTAAAARAKARAAGGIPKRLKARSLASILLEEAGRPDGIATQYIEAESKPPPKGARPRRRFCPVTGLMGIYTEPKSGIPYANLQALEQIRERAPPWMNRGGSASYSEAMRSLKED